MLPLQCSGSKTKIKKKGFFKMIAFVLAFLGLTLMFAIAWIIAILAN
jgi:hypothetical protein